MSLNINLDTKKSTTRYKISLYVFYLFHSNYIRTKLWAFPTWFITIQMNKMYSYQISHLSYHILPNGVPTVEYITSFFIFHYIKASHSIRNIYMELNNGCIQKKWHDGSYKRYIFMDIKPNTDNGISMGVAWTVTVHIYCCCLWSRSESIQSLWTNQYFINIPDIEI